jgi:glycosyltransferase involved in cell wall biosynthesis
MKIAFVLENILGHTTHAANLKQVVARQNDIEPVYIDLDMEMRDHHWLFKVPRYGPLFRLSWTLRCGFEAKRQLKRQLKKLDVIFYHTQITASASRKLMKKRPGVLSLDAAPYSETYYEPWDSEERRIRKRRFYKKLFKQAAHLVAWSQWAKDNLEKYYELPPKKITVIPPGVDLQKFRPPTLPEGQTTRSGDDIVRVLFVGGEFHRKGGAWLSRWAQSTQLKNWELHIVTRDRLSARRYRIPNVFIHNDLQNNSEKLITLYQKCDVFAFPTRQENLGLVAIEAMACGLPVVITDVCATSEVVEDGHSGFLVDPQNRSQFFERLDELVGDTALRHHMGGQARTRATERFCADKNYVQLLELLRSQARRR